VGSSTGIGGPGPAAEAGGALHALSPENQAGSPGHFDAVRAWNLAAIVSRRSAIAPSATPYTRAADDRRPRRQPDGAGLSRMLGGDSLARIGRGAMADIDVAPPAALDAEAGAAQHRLRARRVRDPPVGGIAGERCSTNCMRGAPGSLKIRVSSNG
jgi:hypothetical protein